MAGRADRSVVEAAEALAVRPMLEAAEAEAEPTDLARRVLEGSAEQAVRAQRQTQAGASWTGERVAVLSNEMERAGEVGLETARTGEREVEVDRGLARGEQAVPEGREGERPRTRTAGVGAEAAAERRAGLERSLRVVVAEEPGEAEHLVQAEGAQEAAGDHGWAVPVEEAEEGVLMAVHLVYLLLRMMGQAEAGELCSVLAVRGLGSARKVASRAWMHQEHQSS